MGSYRHDIKRTTTGYQKYNMNTLHTCLKDVFGKLIQTGLIFNNNAVLDLRRFAQHCGNPAIPIL